MGGWMSGQVLLEKNISNQSKKHELVTGLEFDPTDVGALKATITWSFDVAEAVYRWPQWSYQSNVDLKRNQIFILSFIWKKRYMWINQNQ